MHACTGCIAAAHCRRCSLSLHTFKAFSAFQFYKTNLTLHCAAHLQAKLAQKGFSFKHTNSIFQVICGQLVLVVEDLTLILQPAQRL